MGDVAERPPVLTIGHSTHAIERFIALLERHRVELLADVRRFPGSRRHPQFGADALARALADEEIGYVSLGDDLGGRRRARPDSANAGWRSGQFRGYADHMASAEFLDGLDRLLGLAAARPTAVMCAESVWWRCHRRLLADALVLLRGASVEHLFHDGRVVPHPPAADARVADGRLVYDVGTAPALL
jgi:uncharacterized protein (DUF488 family)